MKTHNIVPVLSLMIFSMMFSSCTKSARNQPILHQDVPTIAGEDKSTILTPVITNTPIPSPVILPTLQVEDARTRFLDLLANNGDCRLPCLWGIRPGKSIYQEAQAIFIQLSPLSDITDFLPEGGVIHPRHTDGDLILAAIAGFNVFSSDNQIINRVGLQAREVKKTGDEYTTVFDAPFFKNYLDYYMLPNILTEYGSPTTVMLSTMAKLPSSGVPGGFKILLLYPDQGILVNYTLQMQITGEDVMGCLSTIDVELDLYPSGQPDSFFDALEPSGWSQIIQNTYKPIDEVTSMTKDDFYQTFRQPTDKCVLTPSNLWPVPD